MSMDTGDAELKGMEAFWNVFTSLRGKLFAWANRAGYSRLLKAAGDIKAAIFAHPEFTVYNQLASARFGQWKAAQTPHLLGTTLGDHPKELIASLSESLLSTFQAVPLLDAYDAYQHLMDY